MKKRGIFLVLIVLFSLVAFVGFVFGFGESCELDSDCAAGQNCETVSGFGLRCVISGQEGPCGTPPVPPYTYLCSSDKTKCALLNYVKECSSDTYCSDGSCVSKEIDGEVCSSNVECSSNKCYNSPYFTNNFCVSSSTNWETNCGNGFDSCSSNLNSCKAGSLATKTCSSDHYCKLVLPFLSVFGCVEKLANGMSCNAGNECISGNCIDDVCAEGKETGEYCNADNDCESNICNTVPGGIRSFSICSEMNTWFGYCPDSYECADNEVYCESTSSGISPVYNCAEGYYCNGDACVRAEADGSDCKKNIECRSGICSSQGLCISDNYWIGDCPSGMVCSSDGDSCVPSVSTLSGGAGPGGDISGSVVFELSIMDISNNCAPSYYCSSGENGCVPRLENGDLCSEDFECQSNSCSGGECVSCVLDSQCPSGQECSGGECSVTSCTGVTCSAGQSCNPATGSCEAESCVSDSDCGGATCSGGLCVSSCDQNSDCGENEICGSGDFCEPAIGCSSTDDCSGLEGYSCVSTSSGGGLCQPVDPTDDVDGDGVLDGEDPCVGNPDPDGDCDAFNVGLSCDDLDGVVCDGQCSEGSDWSDISTESNCCVSVDEENAGCQSAPIFLVGSGNSIRFDKTCLQDGKTQVKVVYADTEELVSGEDLAALGLNPTRGNPYIDLQDYSCGSVSAAEGGGAVPGYGLMNLLVAVFILSLFYIRRR